MNQPSKKSGVFRGSGVGFRLSIEILGVWFVCACSAPKALEAPHAPLAPPADLQSVHSQYVGSLLSGPTAGTASDESFVECSIEIVLLRKPLGQELRALAPDMGLVARLAGQNPIQGGSRLSVGARWATDSDADAAWNGISAGDWGEHTLLDSQTALIPLGTTMRMDFAADERIEDPDNFLREWPEREPVHKGLIVGVHYEPGSDGARIVAGFALRDLVAAEGEEELNQVPKEGGRPGADFLIEEWVLPERLPNSGGGTILFWLPSPFAKIGAQSVAIGIRTQGVDAADVSPEALELCQQALESSAVSPREAAAQSEEQAQKLTFVRAIQSAKRAAESSKAGEEGAGQNLRAALVFLCGRAEESLGKDLSLAGDETFLRGWVALIPDPSTRTGADAGDLAWDVERAAWTRMARDMVKEDLPDSLLALVLHHAGEAGHYPSSLEDAARNSANLETFQQRLIQENRLFLEESSPAARVRAYDWLTRRGLEPPDWDPMATKEVRTGPLRIWLATFESGENS